ncbi:conserved protein, unknown function [Hepatocystis sp. ex Piliocolobus tephrosceles]|nr:conserved protein, unknown function [Hepatocystis sp. ex Piliocolobus tephrosceles]
MQLIVTCYIISYVLFLWNAKKLKGFRLNLQQSKIFMHTNNGESCMIKKKNIPNLLKCNNIKLLKHERCNFYFQHNETCNVHVNTAGEIRRDISISLNNSLSSDISNDNSNAVLKDIQGVWKFYLPIFVQDCEFEAPKDSSINEDYTEKTNNIDENNDDNSDESSHNSSNDSNKHDSTLNVLKGERLHPLPMFVYSYEHIISGSSNTYAYWHNEYIQNNIYECTIKLINKMSNKYMIIFQGYLFISKKNILNEKNIRLVPCQIFGNIFLANNDNIEYKNSLIPKNMKVYDNHGNEIKDVLSVLEKKLPEFKKDKQKINAFLGSKKWRYLGISTAYKVLGEEKNIFNIKHMLTKKSEHVFYKVMDFHTLNGFNNVYDVMDGEDEVDNIKKNETKNKNAFSRLNDIFNIYFEKPSDDILFRIMQNVIKK